MTRELLGVVGAASLAVLPGAWVSFGLPLVGLTVVPRVAYSIVLSPAVVFLQFYLLRFAGLQFGATAFLLPLVNIPALWFVVRRWNGLGVPRPRVLIAWGLALTLPLLFLSTWIRDEQVRANWGHAWYHTDVVYMIAHGGLRPEEPQLAGVRLAYPWATDLFHSVTSYLLDAAPNSSYIWLNLVWFAALLVLIVAIVRHVGGDLWARTTSVIWLCFGLNAVGYLAYRVLPQSLLEFYPIFGDWRYTPLIRKFGTFSGTGLGISLFAALVLVSLQPRDPNNKRSRLLLAGALLLALGISYQLLFPAGALVLGSTLVVASVRQRRRFDAAHVTEMAHMLGAVVLATVVTALFTFVVTVDRTASTIALSSIWRMKIKAATSVMVLAPFLLGVVIAGRSMARRFPGESRILLLTAVGCIAAYTVLDVPFPSNEYKFILPAAVCLTPFAAIAWQFVAERTGRGAVAGFAGLALLLALPAVDLILEPLPDVDSWATKVDVGSFALRLIDNEEVSLVYDAIRSRTPLDAVLVSEGNEMDPVALTGRSIYVPMEQEVYGLGMSSDGLLKRTIGYDASVIDQRRETVRDFYKARDDQVRHAVMDRMRRELKRPLVILVRQERSPTLTSWLTKQQDAELLWSKNGQAVWLVSAKPN